MICPSCHSDRAYVHRTQRTLTETSRACRCACGASWWTDERVRRASLVTGKPSLVTHRQRTGELEGSPGKQAVIKKINELAAGLSDSSTRKGGRGGSLSSGSGSLFPVSSPDPSQPSESGSLERSSESSRAKVPGAYSGEFERLWEHTGKSRGNKGAAWKAFAAIRVPKPVPGALRIAWDAYMASSGPVGGFVQHLSTWLNQRGWETDWQPAAKPKTRDDRNSDAIGEWLAKEAARG